MGLKKHINQNLDIEIGSDLTLREYAKLIHNQKDGFITVATKTLSGDWKEKAYPIDDWFNQLIINQNVGCYQSVNSFFVPKRNDMNLRSLHNFYVDIDYYNAGIGLDDAIGTINFLMETERLPEPTMFISSGRGLYLIWNFESVPGAFLNVKKLYNHIQKFLISALKEVGSDAAACDPTRVLRIPGSINPKNKKRVEVIKYTEKTYTMRYLQSFMNQVNDYQPKVYEKKKKKAKLLKLFNFYTLAVARAQDLEKLCELRKYDIDGYGNTLMHIYTYQQMLIHQDYHVVRSKANELNKKLKFHLTANNIDSICKDSVRAFRNKQKDKLAGYNYRTATIVEKLKITESEQRQLSTLIDKGIKQERNTIKKRENRGSVSREEYEQERKSDKEHSIDFIKRQLKKDPKIKQKELADLLGTTQPRISQLLKEIKKI